MQQFSSIPARQARNNELRRYQRWQHLLVQLLLIDKKMAKKGSAVHWLHLWFVCKAVYFISQDCQLD